MKKSLFTLSIPIFFELLLGTLLGNIDTLMISSYSQKAVASLGSMSQVINIQLILLSFISTGSSILIAQYIGAGDKKRIRQSIGISILLNIFLGFLLGGIYLLGAKSILGATKLPDELLEYGLPYFKIVAGFAVFQGILLAVSSILRSYGFTKDILFINIGVNLINVLGNGMFIYGWLGSPVLGLTGVGISTTFSRFIGALFSLFYLKWRLGIRFKKNMIYPFPKDIFKNLLRIGVPSAGENLSWQTAQVLILSMVNTMGITAITARTYLSVIGSFFLLFSLSLGMGTSIIVAQRVGAKDYDSAYSEALEGLKAGLILTAALTALIAFAGKPILEIFTKDPEIISLGRKLLFISLALETGRTFNIIIIGALKSAGDTKFPAVLGIFSMFGIAVTLSWILGIKLGLGLMGIWIANSVDECLRGFIVLKRWKNKKWTTKGFIQTETKNRVEAA